VGAALFGFSKLYGEVPGGQAQYLWVPQAAVHPHQSPRRPRRRPLAYLSDILPTARQSVDYPAVPDVVMKCW